MQTSFVTTALLPAALAVIMFGLGLTLTAADFTRVLRYPKAVFLALGCQLIVLPAVCFGLLHVFDLAPALAVGMMLLAASPGGTTANIFSHLARGDVALNVTLTATNSVIAIVTLPFVVNLSADYFLGGGSEIGLQFGKLMQVFAIVLIPVLLGMLVNARANAFATRMRKPVKIASLVFLVATIAVAIWGERERIGGFLADTGPITVLFSVLSLAIGYLVPRLFRVGKRQAIASGMEIGIHNSTLAITIALSPTLLNNSQMAIPPAVYGVLMFFTAGAFGFLVTRGRDRDTEPVASPS